MAAEAQAFFGMWPAGGMRQVGVLAAPGMVALRETPTLLHADHKNARLLAEGDTSLSSHGFVCVQ